MTTRGPSAALQSNQARLKIRFQKEEAVFQPIKVVVRSHAMEGLCSASLWK